MAQVCLLQPDARAQTARTPAQSAPERIEMLRNLGALATIFVVFWHSRATGLSVTASQSAPTTHWLKVLDALFHFPGIAIHVPLFFLTSGYLFFRQGAPRLAEYGRKMRNRVGTLVVPYVLWNLVLLGAVTALRSLPHLAPLMGQFRPYQGLSDAVWRLTGDPIVYQFWFVRELILLTALAPVFGLAFRSRVAWPCLALIAVAFALGFVLGGVLSARATFFFGLGAFFALRELPLKIRTSGAAKLVFGAALIASAMIRTPSWLYALEVATGVFVALSAYNPESNIWRSPLVVAIRRHAFFVFAFHEPLLMTLRKGVMVIGGTSAPVMAVDLFIAPLLAVAVSVFVGERLSRRFPRVYGTLTGSRSERPADHAVVRLEVVEGGLASKLEFQSDHRVAA